MNTLFSMLSDGAGNTSTTRVVLLLFVIYLLAAKFYLLVKTGVQQPFSGDELSLLGILFSAKLVQHAQEQTPPAPPAKP